MNSRIAERVRIGRVFGVCLRREAVREGGRLELRVGLQASGPELNQHAVP